jgi:hypothetical protein
MAIRSTVATLTLDRENKTGEWSGDKIPIRDESVQLTLSGVNADEIAAGIVFQIYSGSSLLAECSGSEWKASGDSSAVGTLNTNTDACASFFGTQRYPWERTATYRVYVSGQTLVPVAIGYVNLINFPAEDASSPASLTSPYEELTAMKARLDALEAKTADVVSGGQAAGLTLAGEYGARMTADSDINARIDEETRDRIAADEFLGRYGLGDALKNAVSVMPDGTLAQLRAKFEALLSAMMASFGTK